MVTEDMFDSMISTHSAREDGDGCDGFSTSHLKQFQPTPPARTETLLVIM